MSFELLDKGTQLGHKVSEVPLFYKFQGIGDPLVCFFSLHQHRVSGILRIFFRLARTIYVQVAGLLFFEQSGRRKIKSHSNNRQTE